MNMSARNVAGVLVALFAGYLTVAIASGFQTEGAVTPILAFWPNFLGAAVTGLVAALIVRAASRRSAAIVVGVITAALFASSFRFVSRDGLAEVVFVVLLAGVIAAVTFALVQTKMPPSRAALGVSQR